MGDVTMDDMYFCLILYMLAVGKETYLCMMTYLQMTYELTQAQSTRKTLVIRRQQIIVFPLDGSLRGNFQEYNRNGQVNTQTIMRFEAMRIKSFHNIQITNSPIFLARAGFYATGNGDEVRCFSCGARRRNWEWRDNAGDHSHHRPHCRHAQGLDASNVDFSVNPLPSTREIQHFRRHEINQRDLSRRIEDDPRIRYGGALAVHRELGVHLNHTGRSTRKETPSTPRENGETAETPGLDMSQATHPNQQDIDTRIASFQGTQHTHDPLTLALAGFFYAGGKDCVRCFFCGISLHNWNSHNDPWVEHIRFRPECSYLQTMASRKFIQHILTNISCTENAIVINNDSSHQGLEVFQQTIEDLDSRVKIVQRRRQYLHEKMNSLRDGNGSVENGLMVHMTEADFRYRELMKTVTSLNTALSNNDRAEVLGRLREIELRIQELEKSLSEARKCINNGENEQNDNIEILRRRNEDLRNSRRCKICLENEVNILFLPCGHLVTCAQCAPAFMKCPLCRTDIRATLRTNVS